LPFPFFKKDKKDGAVTLPPPVPAAVGAYGKVPKMGDFVRAGAKPLPSFEQWLEAGMAAGEKKYGASWPSVYGKGPIHAFVYRPPVRDGAMLVGVLKPSHDSVGRRFPLVVFAQIAERDVAACPHLLPLVLGDFLEAATSAMTDASTVTSASEYQERIGRVALPYLNTDAAAADYDRWARSTPVSAAWRAIYGSGESDAPLGALKSIREALAPFGERENLTTPLAVRLRLGSAGIAAAVLWLDIVRSVARWRATTPTCFWSFDGDEGSILVQLGQVTPSSLAELWQPDLDSDHVCNLLGVTTNEHRSQLVASFPRQLGAVLEGGDAPVAEMLALLLDR
jgi:type VI secretion system protein ImpM